MNRDPEAGSMRHLKHMLVLSACLVAGAGLTACGGSDEQAAERSASQGSQTDETTGGDSPEEHFAPDSEGVSGLERLSELATEIGAASVSEGKEKAVGLEDIWQPIEGTIKRNEPATYATIEEDLTLLESGDPAKARRAATELGGLADTYVEAHPGGDDESASGATPEEHIASDADVAAGLKRLAALAALIGAASASEGKQKAAGLEDIWKPIEGTIKRNEPDAYATIEEDLTLLGSGVATRARQGARELAGVATSYLAAHPR